MAGWATMLLNQVSRHDLSYKRKTQQTANPVVQIEEQALACMFPVDDRWALEWDDIEGNPETTNRLSEDPYHWLPVSYDGELTEIRGHLLDDLKATGRTS